MNPKNIFSCFSIFLLSFGIISTGECQDQVAEFRGAWIATINNIDWPSKPGLPVNQQKEELGNLIERIADYNLNTVLLQVRAASDAFYLSSTEPWSYFLTGKQGKPPEPLFDPLAYAIEFCHSKGMKLYAWFNPFRVRNIGYYELAKNSFAAKNPRYQHDYDNKRFFDPGFPEVREHVIKVILEVVKNYDLDAILLDDYFYPYPIRGKNFPDASTFAKFGKGYFPEDIKGWRRSNIDSFISGLHEGIKKIKPDLPFGISPFGIWRNKSDDPQGSALPRGTTSYDDLYADTYKWLSKNWIDFIIPQLYWGNGDRYGDFSILVKWWNNHSCGKPVYIGQALYKTTDQKYSWKNSTEISEQINILRKCENIKGFALYSASHLMKLPEITKNELAAQLKIPEPTSVSKENIEMSDINSVEKVLGNRDLSAQENLFEAKINLIKGGKKNKLISVPGKLNIRKNRDGWHYKWIADSLNQEKNLVLLIYQSEKGEGILKKVCSLTNKEFIITQKDFKPRKSVYSIVSLDRQNGQRSFSELFTIKGKGIVSY